MWSYSISFSYGDHDYDCGSDYAEQVDTYDMEKDEFITEISGRDTLNINKVR